MVEHIQEIARFKMTVLFWEGGGADFPHPFWRATGLTPFCCLKYDTQGIL